MWKCDRDGSMFENKKDADAHDKELELGSAFSQLLEQIIPDVDEKKSEEFGLFLARHKNQIMQACKGKPEVLDEIFSGSDNVTALESVEAG